MEDTIAVVIENLVKHKTISGQIIEGITATVDRSGGNSYSEF